MSAYAEGLRDAWEGELFGDLLLRGLSEQLDLPEERRAIFRTLADIEAAMAARLEPLLEPLVPAEVRAGAPDRAAARAAASLADLPDMAAVLGTLGCLLKTREDRFVMGPDRLRQLVEGRRTVGVAENSTEQAKAAA